MNTITVSGERQTGKTELLITQAIEDALRGRRVLYITHLYREMADTFARALNRPNVIDNPDLETVHRASGREQIVFLNGGTIRFVTDTMTAGRGCTYDTVILDGVERDGVQESALVSLNGSADPRSYIVS